MVACVLCFKEKGTFFGEISFATKSFLTQMLNVFASNLFITRKYAKNESDLTIKLILSML